MTDTITGQEIKSVRNRLGLTREEFAHRLGVTFSTVNRWENGHAKPSRLAARALRSLLPPTVPMPVKEAN